jgi:hypothetical protein
MRFDAPTLTLGLDAAGDDRMGGSPSMYSAAEMPEIAEPAPVVLPANQPTWSEGGA